MGCVRVQFPDVSACYGSVWEIKKLFIRNLLVRQVFINQNRINWFLMSEERKLSNPCTPGLLPPHGVHHFPAGQHCFVWNEEWIKVIFFLLWSDAGDRSCNHCPAALPAAPDARCGGQVLHGECVGKQIFPARSECVCSDWCQTVLVQLWFPQFRQAAACDALCLLPGQGWGAHSHFSGVIGVGKLSWEWLLCPMCQYWPDDSCKGLGHQSQQEEKLPQPSSVLWPSPLTLCTVQVLDVQNLLHWKFTGKRKFKFPVHVFQLYSHMGSDGHYLQKVPFCCIQTLFLWNCLYSPSSAAGVWGSKEILGVFRSFLTE